MVQLVIPMNGLGKRFVSEGYPDPKPLIPVWNGKRMIEYVVDCFPGVSSIVMLCHPNHQDRLAKLYPNATIVPVPYSGKGPVDTLVTGLDSISDTEEIVVSYCDYGMDWNFAGFLRDMRSHNAQGGIACYRGFHPHHLGPDCYAYVQATDDNWVRAIREKRPFTEHKQSEWASSGAYYFCSKSVLTNALCTVLAVDSSINGEHYVSMCYNHIPSRVFPIERMLQFGTPRDLRDYQMWADTFSRPRQFVPTCPGVTVLPMAGRGSRFSMVGYTLPKPFLPIDGRPMVCSALECIPSTSDVRIVTLRENPSPASILPAATQIRVLADVTDGQATTVMSALDDVSDDTPLTVTACDNGALYSADRLNMLLEDSSIDAIVWAFRGDVHPTSRYNQSAYAWLDVDDQMMLRDVSVKRIFSDRPNRYCIIGTMFFRRTRDFRWSYEQCRSRKILTNGEYYVDNLLTPMLEKGSRIAVFPVDHYLCWGTPNDYETFTYWAGHFTHANRSTQSEHIGTFA